MCRECSLAARPFDYTAPLAMSARRKAWLQIHFCVVLWGFTAIFGRVIRLSALPLVLWRMTLVGLALFALPRFWAGLRRVPRRLFAVYAGIGVLIALHWLCFYQSIKLANASIAVTCIALGPTFTTLVERPLTGRPVPRYELLLGIAVVPAVALVVGATPSPLRDGYAVGVLSALLMALFAVLNKRFLGTSEVLTVTGIEMLAGAAFLLLSTPLLPAGTQLLVLPDAHDAALLVLLAVLCTLVPFALSLVAMRQLSVFSAALATNMEPVYAIVLAMVFLGEQRELTIGFYAGVLLMLVLVFAHPMLSRRAAA
jgi:drug/metabolite transporter (DMT)-like permease